MVLPNIHILGIQGSGKGTQSALLEHRFGFTYISSGDLFRRRALQEDEMGVQIAGLMQKGRLLPDELLVEAVDSALREEILSNGVLGDGVLRTGAQKELLAAIWQKYQLDEPLLVHLRLTEETALKRIEQRKLEASETELSAEKKAHLLKYGGKVLKRVDDNPQAIAERFALFHHLTEPLITVFESEGRCIHVDGEQPIERVFHDICLGIEDVYPQLFL